MRQIISTVLGRLNPSIENDIPIFDQSGYTSNIIKSENFHNISYSRTTKTVIYIDGGNAEIIGTPNLSLQYIRLFGCVIKGKKKIRSHIIEFFSLATLNDRTYKVEIFPVRGTLNLNLQYLSINSMHESIRDGINRAKISQMGEITRRFSEITLAKDLIPTLNKGDIIVLDGTLQCTVQNEDVFFNELYSTATQHGIIITGLAKTTQLLTKNNNSLTSAINRLSPGNTWYYYPITQINTNLHRAEMCITKLHKSSSRIFRFDVHNEFSQINEILSTLQLCSNDIILPGYPYGLMLADKFARVSNKEKDYLKTLLETRANDEWKTIRNCIDNVNTHNILDNIG